MNRDLGLLILRVGFGVMMAAHGWGKVMMLVSGDMGQWADPIGIGMTPSLALAAFAEFFCAVAVILGLWTRWAAIPVVVTMAVAGLVVHSADPWNVKELAFVYLVGFLGLVFTGSGKFSLDAMIAGRRR